MVGKGVGKVVMGEGRGGVQEEEKGRGNAWDCSMNRLLDGQGEGAPLNHGGICICTCTFSVSLLSMHFAKSTYTK